MNGFVLRILDANANRAREALRVVEDYARFVLNDDCICGALKQLRHDFMDATRGFVADAILHRDTPGDVGTITKTQTELHRDDLGHVLTAAGKRLGEALRTIEEYLKTLDPANAAKVESLRYRFYALEQQIAQTLRPAACAFANVKLYVLITQALCSIPWLEAAQLAIEGGADCLQLREKELESRELLKRARRLVALCRKHKVISIINDRPDIAILADADGVHVGQGDLPCTDARKLLGRNRIIGVSTHHIDQAKQAVRDGADYIGVGPVYPSTTKPRDFLPGLDYAREIAAAKLPIAAIAIAGITLPNVDDVIATGVSGIAVTAAVVGAPDIRAAASELRRRLTRAASVGQTFLSVSLGAGRTDFQSVIGRTSGDIPVPRVVSTAAASDEQVHVRQRHLPHWTMAGATYFLTFRVQQGEFSVPERLAILRHIRDGDTKFYNLLAAVIMPDHAHALLEPLPGLELSRIMKGIKGASARQINALRHTSGTVWQNESFDRIMRNQSELEEKVQYIVNNPVKRELVNDPWEYPALYVKQP